MKITSVNNPQIKEYVKLHNNKEQKLKQQFLVETKHLVAEAIKAQVVDVVITTVANYRDFANVIYTNASVMKKLSQLSTPSDMVAVCHMTQSAFDKDSDYLILDDVQDPGNMGTILRTALAFNIKNIILSNQSAHLYNQKVIQSSQGALFHLNIKQGDIIKEIISLKQQQYTIIGTALDGASDLVKNDHYDHFGLVLGNEGQGMHEDVKALCDVIKYIKINNINSLNVAISAAIIMYQLQD